MLIGCDFTPRYIDCHLEHCDYIATTLLWKCSNYIRLLYITLGYIVATTRKQTRIVLLGQRTHEHNAFGRQLSREARPLSSPTDDEINEQNTLTAGNNTMETTQWKQHNGNNTMETT